LDFGLSWLTSLQFIQYHVAGFYKPTIPQSPPSHLRDYSTCNNAKLEFFHKFCSKLWSKWMVSIVGFEPRTSRSWFDFLIFWMSVLQSRVLLSDLDGIIMGFFFNWPKRFIFQLFYLIHVIGLHVFKKQFSHFKRLENLLIFLGILH
jgi:hypothetical protein